MTKPRVKVRKSRVWLFGFVLLLTQTAAQTEQKKLQDLPVLRSSAPAQAPVLKVVRSQIPLEQEEKKKETELKEIAVVQLSEQKVPRLDPEGRYTLSARGALIQDVVLALAEASPYSFVIDPEIQGSVTIDLKGASLDLALESILRPFNIEYRVVDNFILIHPAKMQTRIFEINLLNMQRNSQRSLSASSAVGGGFGGGLGGGFAGGVGGGVTPTTGVTGAAPGVGVTGAGVTGVGGVSGGGTLGGSFASVSSSTQQDIFKDLETELKAFLSADGQVTISKQSGLIMVTDFPQVLDAVNLYLTNLEVIVQRQVSIEARILEVALSESSAFGINFANLANTLQIRQAFTGTTPDQPQQGGFTIGVTEKDFSAIIEILKTLGKVEVLSSPHITTMNNSPAIFRAGTQDVFFQSTTFTQTTQTGPFLQTVTTPIPISEGILLDVTPQISADGFITMNIQPSVTERTGVATSRFGDQFPILSVRETNTIVRVKEGETIIIAGLIEDNREVNVSKVPGLGDIPLIGRLFKRTTEEKRKSDLVIILSPRILRPGEMQGHTIRVIENQNRLRGTEVK